MSQLVTGEAVSLDLPVAALPSRVLGRGIDLLVQAAALLALGALGAAVSLDLSDSGSAALGIVVLVVVLVGYPVALETLSRGRTLGKMALGLRVVRDDGGPVGFRHAFTRGLGTVVDLPTFFVLSVVTMLVSARSKRLGDLLAGTVVVLERVPAPTGQAAQMPPELAQWAGTLELSRLDDGLAASVRQFVARAGELTPAAREDLGGRLVRAVADVTAPPPPPGTPGGAYLSAVLAERRRRASQAFTGPAAPASPPAPLPPPDDRPGGFSLPS